MATSFRSQKPFLDSWQRVKALLGGGRSGGVTLLGGKGEMLCKAKGLSQTPNHKRNKDVFLASHFQDS